MAVIQPEGDSFHFVIDVLPKDVLDAVPSGAGTGQVQFGIEELGDDLRILVRLENHVAPAAYTTGTW